MVGLKDVTPLRKEVLDSILDPKAGERFASICKMIAAIRSFLNDRGFLEFTTPVIQPQCGGGTAKPFKTHVNALGCEMYLAISHELYLKRLIAAGYDKVYTVGRYLAGELIEAHHPLVAFLCAGEITDLALQLHMVRYLGLDCWRRGEFVIRCSDLRSFHKSDECSVSCAKRVQDNNPRP